MQLQSGKIRAESFTDGLGLSLGLREGLGDELSRDEKSKESLVITQLGGQTLSESKSICAVEGLRKVLLEGDGADHSPESLARAANMLADLARLGLQSSYAEGSLQDVMGGLLKDVERVTQGEQA